MFKSYDKKYPEAECLCGQVIPHWVGDSKSGILKIREDEAMWKWIRIKAEFLR